MDAGGQYTAERLIQQLKAEGWKEQRSGTCYVNGKVGSNLLKDGQVITVQQELRPDEDFLEQEWGEEEA
jgi:hypothetical protein